MSDASNHGGINSNSKITSVHERLGKINRTFFITTSVILCHNYLWRWQCKLNLSCFCYFASQLIWKTGQLFACPYYNFWIYKHVNARRNGFCHFPPRSVICIHCLWFIIISCNGIHVDCSCWCTARCFIIIVRVVHYLLHFCECNKMSLLWALY